MSISTSKKLLDKSEVEEFVKRKDPGLSFVVPPCGKSEHWANYHQVVINAVRQNYIVCNDCSSVLTWYPSNGTGVMKKHTIACSKTKEIPSSNQPRITSSFKALSQVTPEQLRSFKKKILHGAAEMCVLDLRPFNIINGKGFEEYSKQVFDAGRYFGNMVDVTQLLPHRTTIGRHVDSLYSLHHQQLRELCQTLDSFSITVDFWTEDFSGVSFAGIALHFCCEREGLVTLALCCRPYDLPDATAANVRLFVDQVLSEFNLKLTAHQFVVSDNEPKMKCAFKDNITRIGCSCHYLNKSLEKSFTHPNSTCDQARLLFNTTRPIVIHMIRSHKQTNLDRRLQLYCKVRWHSIYSMFFTFDRNLPNLRSLLDQNNQQLFDTIDQELMRQLIPFLKVFVDVTERLSNEKQPTLHLVIPCRQKLIDIAKKLLSNEHPGLTELKRYFLQHLENDWLIQDEHYIATVLHPQFKQFDFFDKKVRRHAHDLIKSRLRIDSTKPSLASDNDRGTIARPSVTNTSASIDYSDGNSLLSSLYDKPKDSNKSKSEFDIYLNSNLRCEENEDLLRFWLQQRENFPQLYLLAKQVLIIPASNTCVERMFSVSGATITDRRTRLDVDKIDKMMFLNRNLVYLKSLRYSNEKDSQDDTSHPAPASNKRTLSMNISESVATTKRKRLSTGNVIVVEEDEESQSSDDCDDD